jgi:cysteine desulfurase
VSIPRNHRIYLDHNATTPLHARVVKAMSAVLAGGVGNPSSVHREGRLARDRVEVARVELARALGAQHEDLVFTSGGTEADCLGLVGLARIAAAAGRPKRLLIPAIEHPAVHGAAQALAREGFEIAHVPVEPGGAVAPDALRDLVAGGAAVFAIALVNHELGTHQDVAALAEVAHEAGVLVHCDAVQAAGRIAVDVGALGADAIAVSGHKMYGPRGVGALWIRAGIDLEAVLPAGHQERKRRPGTENVVGIVGMGAAATHAIPEALSAAPAIERLCETLERGLTAIDGAVVHGAASQRAPGTVNVGFRGALGDVIVQALDLAGIAASTGAACTSGTVAPSPVLLGLGLSDERAREAVRFSLGTGTTEFEVKVVLEKMPSIVKRAKAFR